MTQARWSIPILGSMLLGVGTMSSSALAQGQAVGWGQDLAGQTSVPPASLLGYRQVTASLIGTGALLVDGSFVQWGDNLSNQRTPPADLGAVTLIASGTGFWFEAAPTHYAALRTNGTVACWGSNEFGESNVPTGLSNVIGLAAGAAHTVALRSNGSLVCWGAGSTNTGTYPEFGQSIVPAGLGSVTRVQSGAFHNVAIRTDGTVACWGWNIANQCTVPTGLGTVIDVSAGQTHTMAVRTDGTVACWGANGEGQCSVPAGLAGVTRVSAGWLHSLALRSDGTVVAWGAQGSPYFQQDSPTDVPAGLAGVVEIAAGGFHSVARLADGSVRAWGNNFVGACSVPASSGALVAIDAGEIHTIAIRSDGQVVCRGANDEGQANVPAALGVASMVSAGDVHSMAIRQSDGSVFCWGANDEGQLDVPGGLPAATAVAGGHFHSLALVTGGAVHAWGSDSYGQCQVPVDLGVVTAISAGLEHSMALQQAGTVRCWGDNFLGQCSVPAGLSGVTAISAGREHSVALRSNGTVVCWGRNDEAQCTVPAGLSGIIAIAAGEYHTVALRSNGTVACWGANSQGECTPPAGLSGVTAIAAGGGFTMAILDAERSGCNGAAGNGAATLAVSGSSWQDVGAWQWSIGGPRVPGALSSVDLGDYGSVGSLCDARCTLLTTRGGSTVIVPVDLTVPSAQQDHSIDVSGTALLAGRVWLVASGASVLPADLNIPVVRSGSPVGTFDVIQTTVPPPPGKFLALVPSASVAGTTSYALRLLDLPGSASLTGATTAAYAGTAVAAEAMDWNGDGFDDLALAISFGAATPGRLQVLLNDGSGNLGLTSVQVATAAGPNCLAVGDVNGDGKIDAVVGTTSDNRVRSYLNAAPSTGPPFTAGVTIVPVGPILSVVVVPPSGSSLLGLGGTIGAGTGTTTGTEGGDLTLYAGDTGAQLDTVAVPTTPTTTTTRGRRVATGGASSTTVDGLGATQAGRVTVLSEPTANNWVVSQSMPLPGLPVAIEMIDIDGDGLDEIVTANDAPQIVATGAALPVLTLFRGTASSFGAAVPIAPDGASAGIDLALIDADDDGDRDIVSVQRTTGTQSKAVLIQIDTPGPGAALTLGQETDLGASQPSLCSRGNLDGIGGEDLFLVDEASTSLVGGAGTPSVVPFVGDGKVPPTVPGDVNGDGIVDGTDLALVLSVWGSGDDAADLNGDGVVDGGDLALVLSGWTGSTPPPTVSSVTPAQGPSTGGTAITITGTNFTGATAVRIGGVAVPSFTIVSSTSISAVTPAGTAGVASVSVQGPGGTGSLANGFTYQAPPGVPTIASISPGIGPVSGGTAITITGTNFVRFGTSVTVGGAAVTNLVVFSPTQMTAVTPPGSAGARNVVVTVAAGSATSTGGFTYIAAPTVASISPSFSPVAGGATVTISGTGFTAASTVSFGGVPASSVTFVSSTTLNAVTPARPLGVTDVTVGSTGGSTSAMGSILFGVAPSWGTVVQGVPNPSILTSAALRDAIKDEALPWMVRHTATQMDMLLVPSGTFVMGASVGDTLAQADESPTREVTISQPFYIGRTEVTQAQWQGVIGSNPSNFPNLPNNPVERISWTNAQSFCALTGMRLPTEAEWEYACRGGTTTTLFGTLTNVAWYSANSGTITKAVATKAANPLGLHDTIGNVWEWCADWYGPYTAGAVTDPTGAGSGANRVLRGGSFSSSSSFCRSSVRANVAPINVAWNYGMRAVRTPGPIVTAVADDFGGTAGGKSITVSGRFLDGTTGVTIGGASVTSFTVVSPTELSVVTPAGTIGAKDLVVTTASGSVTVPGAFTYYGVPTIASITPSFSPLSGGAQVSIVGTNLLGTSNVSIARGGSIVVISSTEVRFISRQTGGNGGVVDVTLDAPGGTVTLPQSFMYGTPPSWGTVQSGVPSASEVTNSTLRSAILASGLPWSVRDAATGIDLVLVPPGTYSMGVSPGDTEAAADESPAHQVTITKAFYMGRTEVTQAQWVARMGSNPSQYSTAADSPTRPVERITWNDTQSFLAGTGLRLPTEAEWELACRAGTTASRYGLVTDVAWTNSNAGGQTKPVATRVPNALGLHDTLGNVYEWVADRYGPYGGFAQADPTGPTTGTNRVLRGGSWVFAPSYSRASERDNLGTTVGYNDVGVRVARTPGPVITLVLPSQVSSAGGTTITVSGAFFTGATGVKVGGVPATAVNVLGDSTLTCVVPPGALGNASVEVLGPLGSGTRANAVTYIGAPTIEFIGPTQGPSSGGTVVDIWGTNFGDLQSIGVTIGGVAATNIVATSTNRIQVTTPAGTAGSKAVALTTVGGTATVANGFTYVNSPSVTGASPDFSTLGGGGTVTISGSNFVAPVTVRIGGTIAQNVTVVSSSSVTATVPPNAVAGFKTIEVTALGGTGSLANGFLYGTAPAGVTVLNAVPSASVVTNTTLRNAIIASGRPWRVRDNTTNIEMLLIPAGSFTMGAVAADANDQADEGPSHVVTISNAFYLGRFEVTQTQWLARMGSNPSSFQGSSYPDFLNRPVESVSFNAVAGFLSGSGLRLPTEAEWEFACRAGTAAVTNVAGGQVLDEVAWYSINSAVNGVRQPRVVGTRKANALGLYDTLGNVYEHCSDWYSSTYYSSSPSTNPAGPGTGTTRVIRGGSWNNDATFMRCSNRESFLPSSSSNLIGFRVARTP